ncbi:MAG: hypothetical protein QOG28_3403, partial [Trebonia sp.]|nr:hypothetical protein [Trebonia sp.]
MALTTIGGLLLFAARAGAVAPARAVGRADGTGRCAVLGT